MAKDIIPDLIKQVSPKHLSHNLFYLSKDPLPYRKLNYTLLGHTQNTLYEADDFIQSNLESWGYPVEKEGVQVQAFGCDTSKPKAHQYATPESDSSWFTAYNIYAKKQGIAYPDEIILFLAHKDSQSWVDCPGAYDNAVGTVAIMEIARVLKDYPSQRSFWFLFCNEEHKPWTSATAAQNAKERNDNLVAIFNTDSLGGKSQEDIDAGRKTNMTLYTKPEGERFADLMAEVNEAYEIGLIQEKFQRKSPGDDDGSYINAGYPIAVANLGSYPYADPNYHIESDIPENVDIPNVLMATQASLAAALKVDLGEI